MRAGRRLLPRFPRSPSLLLSALVACRSDDTEAAAGELVAGLLRLLGADVETVPLAPGRPNVIGVFEPAGPADATVVFAPHLDTVAGAGMTVPPYALTARGGRLYGRGACDTKGPTAALLWALRRWTRMPASRRGRTRWVVAATASEEPGSLGARQLVRMGVIGPARAGGARSRARVAADFAVALEPTELRVVRAAKGLLRLWIETRGRAAHGARPERGDNAVYRMLPLALALRDRVAPALAASRHPLLGRASLNLGLFSGGSGINVVPDRCRIGLDVRVHPACPPGEAIRLISRAARQTAPRATIETLCEGPSFVTDAADPWARRLRAAGRGWATADWFSDANIFAGAGIPAVAFGPGAIAQAHTRDEHIAVRELEAGAAAFLGFLGSPRPGK